MSRRRQIALLASLLAACLAASPAAHALAAGSPEGDELGDAHAHLYAAEELAGFATELEVPEADPLEEMNRAVFGFNERVDRFVVDPVGRAYGWVVPDPAERAVLRFFANLNSPAILLNDILQLEAKRAGVTLSRFVINTTAGVGGLFDVADSVGLDAHHADFGQTMARAGLGSGPYLVIPMLGPSTARDAFGSAVDLLFRPHLYVLGPVQFLLVGSGNGFVARESYIDELEALRDSSVDFYATMRNLYFQRRAEQLREVGVEVALPVAGDGNELDP